MRMYHSSQIQTLYRNQNLIGGVKEIDFQESYALQGMAAGWKPYDNI